MDLEETLAKLRNEEITAIYELVRVQFDNAQQTPLGFQWDGRHHEVLKLLQVSKSLEGFLQYLILTDKGVFSLTLYREIDVCSKSQSKWMLNYQVNEDNQLEKRGGVYPKANIFKHESLFNSNFMNRKKVVPLLLSNVAYYHGHLCPELVVGYRAALIAEEELGISRKNAHQFFILAENMSSSIEALQLMTGCTIGNQNFFAYDQGKHVYYFGSYKNAHEPGKALRLALTNLAVDLSHKGELEEKILTQEAPWSALKEYHQAIDNAVEEILNTPAPELFTSTRISLQPPRQIGRQDYTRCAYCSEVITVARAITVNNRRYCRACSAKDKHNQL